MDQNLVAEFVDLRDRCDHLMTYEQQIFFQLAGLLRPEWSESDVFEITTKLVHTVNQQLQSGQLNIDQLRNTPENRPMSLFLNLRSLKETLSGVACDLLCKLFSTVPAGDPAQRHAFLSAVQERFQLWSNSAIEIMKQEFDLLPVYQRHNYIVNSLQDTAPQVYIAINSLFSFPLPDVLAFKSWIESLDAASINVIANLFQFNEDFIVQVWSLLCAPLPNYNYGLGSSQDGYSMLTTSFGTSFPLIHSTDDGISNEWQRNKKRTAGGSSKHVINLNDSAGGVNLRLSSSLNFFAPPSKRAHFSSLSPSSGPVAEFHSIQMPGYDMLSTSSGTSTSLHPMLRPSDAPGPVDGLRSSNWAVLPPKFYTDGDDTAASSGSNKDSLSRHFEISAPQPLQHQDELRTTNNDISSLTISQELSAASSRMAQNAAFFPPAPSFAPQTPPTFGQSPVPMNSSLGIPTAYDGIPVGNPMLHVSSHKSTSQSNNVGVLNGVRLELRIISPPPAKSVYQRILKPYPVVKVIGAEKLVNRVLFLKASLWNADGTTQMTCLDGGLQVAAQPTTATFKKLKVLNTSVQKGTLFKLRFQLEVFGEREQAHDIHIWSDPMEVVSHTVYLTNPSNAAPTPATVTEAIPNCGKVGARVVILGSSFIDGESVRVKFGDVIAHHVFHESGALIAHAPAQPHGLGGRVFVSVANDGTDYSASSAAFTYI